MTPYERVICDGNMRYKGVEPFLPPQELIDKLSVRPDDITEVVDRIDIILRMDPRPTLYKSIGKMSYTNECFGLAGYCADKGKQTYDCCITHDREDYPEIEGDLIFMNRYLKNPDIIIDMHDRRVYRVYHH